MATPETAHTPPQNLEAEESALGAMMVSEGAIDAVILDVRLNEEDFYREGHRIVYRAIKALHERGDPVDSISVAEHLTQTGELAEAGGRENVTQLPSSVPAPGNARHYARIVKQNALLRRLLNASHRIQKSVHEREGEPSDLVEQAESLLFRVAYEDRASDFRKVADILAEEVDRLEALAKGDRELTGTASGFRDLDNLLGGFQPGNLIILAARPAMGKSALVCNIADNVAGGTGKTVAFFSLEMSEVELAHRFISCRAKISNDKLRKGKVTQREWPKVLKACNELEHAPLWLDDSSDLSLLDLRAKARRLASSEGGELGLIIVDYMQLMRADDPRANRVEQVGQISRGLKVLARELNVPVIGLSQLSRAPELRTGPDRGKPMLSDLRESGCLTGDSRVFLPDTGRYATMSELEGTSGFRVLALNEQTWKLEPRMVTRAFSTGTKRIHRLRTQLGREIRATANHRFLTLEGWKRLDELAEGDRIALPRRLPAADSATMGDSELALLGHLIGDGCTLPRHAIQYTTNDEGLANEVKRLAAEVFGDRVVPRVVEEHDRRRGRSWFQVYLPSAERLTHGRSSPVAAWLRDLGAFGLRSHEKLVPEKVFEQPASGIQVFLRHLWSTDGCVLLGGLGRSGRHNPRIYYATSSRRLGRDVQALLLRLGINARVVEVAQRRGRAQFHVVVSGGADQRRFLELVGGLGASKASNAREILDWLSGHAQNTNRDVIPREAWPLLVKPALTVSGTTTRQLQAGLGMSYCGSTLYRSGLSRERASRVAGVLDMRELKALAESDAYWDSVASLDPAGEERVYDLTVEGLHNFVAEDIVVHNSIEQDADVVAFIFRESIYNEEADPSLAELIVAKHRNGPTGSVDMVFLEQYPRFVDRAHTNMERPVDQRPGEGPPLVDMADEA